MFKIGQRMAEHARCTMVAIGQIVLEILSVLGFFLRKKLLRTLMGRKYPGCYFEDKPYMV